MNHRKSFNTGFSPCGGSRGLQAPEMESRVPHPKRAFCVLGGKAQSPRNTISYQVATSVVPQSGQQKTQGFSPCGGSRGLQAPAMESKSRGLQARRSCAGRPIQNALFAFSVAKHKAHATRSRIRPRVYSCRKRLARNIGDISPAGRFHKHKPRPEKQVLRGNP
jgi:hypothetical protein